MTVAADHALSGIRVLDLTDELGAYATRLLADLGADVIRVEPPGGSRTRQEPPLVEGPAGTCVSAFDAFVNAGKRSVTIDLRSVKGRAVLHALIGTADVLVESFPAAVGDRFGLEPFTLAAANPGLVHVSVTPFGRGRSGEAVDDDDLTIMAAGGLLHLGGYADSEPVVAYGGQARNAASLFAAVGALVTLLHREKTGRGDWIDVSAQECVAQALEDSVATYEFAGDIRQRLGSDAREAGSGVYTCADGQVSMIAGRVGTAKAWRALVAWLVESDATGAEALQGDPWASIRYRQTPAAIAEFGHVFGEFARTRSRLELYGGAQARGIALSPVNDICQLMADEQLRAREFWVTVPEPVLGGDATFPGPPYRLSETPAVPARSAPRPGADTDDVLGELGDRGRARPSADAMTDERPLTGVRVLDFTWVGAGALATKLMADLGADVIKIESRARPDNLRLAPPFRHGHEDLEGSGYFASRNSSKRSFALNMALPASRAIALRMAAQADVVASNFRPGIMERWGMSYPEIKAINPSVVYLTMPMQGSSGPHAAFTGFGATIAALSGLVSLSGLPDRPAVGTGTHFPDHVPNPGHALVGTLAALLHRARTGVGQAVEVSQLESTINVIGPAIVEASLAPERRQVRAGNRATGASPRGVFPCAIKEDWVAIVCRTDAHWKTLADVLGEPGLAFDDRFVTLADRHAHEDELERIVSAKTQRFDRAELVNVLRQRGVPAAPVNSSKDILSDPDLVARGYWKRLEHPVIGEMSIARPPMLFGSGNGAALTRPPLLGEHTAEIARDVLGMTDEDTARLIADGVLA